MSCVCVRVRPYHVRQTEFTQIISKPCPPSLLLAWQYLTKVAAMQSTQAVSARLLRGHGGPVEVVADLPVDVRAHKVIVVGRFAFERHAAQLTAEAHVGVVVLGLFRVDRGSG